MSISTVKLHHAGNLSPEYALLGFLLTNPSHGYDLHQHFLAELGHVWHLSQSQAYAILKRLEKRGDISAHIVTQDKLPERQILRITGSGRHRFMNWLEKGVSKNARAIRLEFLTRLYFARLHKPEIIKQIYEAQCAEIGTSIEHLEQLLGDLSAKQVFNRLSLDLRLRQMKLIREWMSQINIQFITLESEIK